MALSHAVPWRSSRLNEGASPSRQRPAVLIHSLPALSYSRKSASHSPSAECSRMRPQKTHLKVLDRREKRAMAEAPECTVRHHANCSRAAEAYAQRQTWPLIGKTAATNKMGKGCPPPMRGSPLPLILSPSRGRGIFARPLIRRLVDLTSIGHCPGGPPGPPGGPPGPDPCPRERQSTRVTAVSVSLDGSVFSGASIVAVHSMRRSSGGPPG